TFGYLEDPATGSGNAALGCYLLKNGKWDGACISLEQNASAEQPNIVKISAGQDNQEVAFGGSAILRIRGEYILT
ncbi:PhzF family phenazine biosynthesis protein, partial [bacterium]|nr:PhzF family phenazine biosynthesis protein [bacterium]